MNDLISRQEDLISREVALTHIDDVPYIKEHPNVGLLWKAWIESLPAAQPDVPDTNVGDMISRQTVLRCLIDISYNQCKTQGEADVIDTAKTMVSVMPSAQPEQKWIPCTPKTMPPYWVLVWVTDNHGHVAVCQLSYKENHYWYDGDERWMYEHDSIIAWMPYNVPEPYQAERREE